MVLDLVEDMLEAIQNAILVSFGTVFDVFFNPMGIITDIFLWVVASALVLLLFL